MSLIKMRINLKRKKYNSILDSKGLTLVAQGIMRDIKILEKKLK